MWYSPKDYQDLWELLVPLEVLLHPIRAGQIADMLSEKKVEDAKAESTYFTETRFTKTGIDRRTVSDFGLIGSIIAQLAQD